MRAFEGVSTTSLLQNAMSILEERHRVIANNIANVGTPGYQPVDVDFHKTLERAVRSRDAFYGRMTHPRHIPIVHKRPALIEPTIQSHSGRSGVDIEYEMGELTENTALYSTYSALLRKRFALAANMLRNLR